MNLTETHRRSQLTLRQSTVRDLMRLWPALDVKRLDETYPAWAEAVGLLVARNRATSTSLAAAYMQALRASKIGLEHFAPTVAKPAPPSQVQAYLISTAVLPIKKAMTRGVLLDAAAEAAFVLSSGAVSKLVLDGGRGTIFDTILADPKAKGYRRVTDDHPCSFCALLATRGMIYASEQTATVVTETETRSTGPRHGQRRFRSARGTQDAGEPFHAYCACTAEPVYETDDFGPRPEAEPWLELYERSTAAVHGSKEKQAAFRAAYADAYGR